MTIIYACPPGEAWLGTILRHCIRLDGLGNVATNNAKILMVNKNSAIFSHSNLLVQVSLQVFSMWGPSIPG